MCRRRVGATVSFSATFSVSRNRKLFHCARAWHAQYVAHCGACARAQMGSIIPRGGDAGRRRPFAPVRTPYGPKCTKTMVSPGFIRHTTRTSRDPSPETSLTSFVTSLTAAVSSLRRFSGPRPLQLSLFNLAQSEDSTSEFYFSICFLWEAYRDCFYNFSFSLHFFFLRSFTWRACHSQPLFVTRRLHFMKSASLK